MLPKLNDTPQYELVIPSTGKSVSFRPYLVKEEKVLLIASESKDMKQITGAIVNTVKSCSYDKLDTDALTTFDLEYLFLKLRAMSVGEVANLNVKCQHCEKENEYNLNLDSIVCSNTDVEKTIKLNDKITIEMQYPSYTNVLFGDDTAEDVASSLMASCLKTVITEDERIDVSEESIENITEFFESMTKEQFMKISEFFDKIPKVECDIDFTCGSCGEDNHIELRGIQDFF